MILVIDMNWKRESLAYYEFVLPILEVIHKFNKYSVKHYLDFCIEDLNGCDSVILSGTPLEDIQFLANLEYFCWLKEAKLPVLGICAGMEAIGAVFGASLSKTLEIGMIQIVTLRANHLFSRDFRAYSLHSLCVEPSDNLEVLAESGCCIQAIKHKTKPIYGVLFHPEVRNQQIIENFSRS